MPRTVRLGAGAGWWGDRIDPAALNARAGRLDYLCFETMAEATVSAAQVRKRRDPQFAGYDTWLDARMRAVLPHCLAQGTRIISNQGWINPQGAAQRIAALAAELGYPGVCVAAVSGSQLDARVTSLATHTLEDGRPLADLAPTLVSAEAYLGAEPIVAALQAGARIVVTGRVADPALFLAPLMFEFGWAADDWARLGAGSGIGHLLECGAQLTGGYFADPGFKDVPEPWNLAFPIAEVAADGSAVLSKVAGTGGELSLATVKEQLLYEVHDPARYLTPDVTVDFTGTQLEQIGPDCVAVRGITGTARTATLKVSVACLEGYMGEDLFFQAGPGAVRRARLAQRILEERLRIVNLQADDLRIELLGLNAIHGQATPADAPEPYEVAVRVAARTRTADEAAKIGREVDGMAVCGVAHTGKRVPWGERVREVVGLSSVLVPRTAVTPQIDLYTS